MSGEQDNDHTSDQAGRATLLEDLLSSWPVGEPREAAREQTTGESERFLDGRGASLPFLFRDGIVWATVAPSTADLHREIEFLRAWVLPTFGWEDPRHPFVAPGEGSNPVATALLKASPAGYFRWRCTREDFATVATRLRRMRTVAARRPEHLHERVPSLLELRQQFRTALLTGARESAEAAVRSIDQYQLDSAVNTQLMRVRMLDQFGEFAAIADNPTIERLFGLRLPQSVRTAIIRAFHATRVAPSETESVEAAAIAYRDAMHSAVGGLLALARPADGPEVARSLAYRTWVMGDQAAAIELLASAEATVVPLLKSVLDADTSRSGTQSLAEVFEDALRRGDLRAVQAIAPSLLADLTAASGADVPSSSLDAVRESLEVLPNAALAAAITEVQTTAAHGPSTPQSWSDLLARLRSGDVTAAERFLALDEHERPGPEHLPTAEREAAVAALEELLTAPAFGVLGSGPWVADVALPAFVDDFVSDPQFPRSELAPLYLQLLRLWAEYKRGSAYAPDAQLVLMLASAVLRRSANHEEEVAGILIEWWRTRPIRAALPFLLEALDIILELTAPEGPAQQLWLDGASLAARDPASLSGAERLLWRRLGLRAGFDESAITEVLPDAPAEPAQPPEADAVRGLDLQKIAIVSLHRRAAEEAREILAQRTGASVFVVDEMVVGPGARAAQTADVVLFVWAATKHAVFRAFDAVRDRVVYVQGTGAGSIVLALERWAILRADRMRDNAEARSTSSRNSQ